MEYRIATLDEIRIGLFAATQEALAAFPDVWLVTPAQDAAIDVKRLAVFCSLTFSKTGRAEFGGHGSLAERSGFWKMLVSILPGTDENLALELAQGLEDAFLPYATEDFPLVSRIPDDPMPVCPLFCEFPYTENIGEMPDKRNGITVTVPFRTWTQA